MTKKEGPCSGRLGKRGMVEFRSTEEGKEVAVENSPAWIRLIGADIETTPYPFQAPSVSFQVNRIQTDQTSAVAPAGWP